MSRLEGGNEPRRPTADVAATAAKILANMEKVVIGKKNQLTLCLVAYLCEGHILLEDVPGVAKTMLARCWPAASAAPSNDSSVRPTCCRPT